MAEYIDKTEVVNKLIRLENNYQFYKEKWDAEVLYRRICELEIGIGKTPAADVAEVHPKLRKAVKLLGENYERGLNSDYVRNPVAWALYQTWKKMDGGADNGE